MTFLILVWLHRIWALHKNITSTMLERPLAPRIAIKSEIPSAPIKIEPPLRGTEGGVDRASGVARFRAASLALVPNRGPSTSSGAASPHPVRDDEVVGWGGAGCGPSLEERVLGLVFYASRTPHPSFREAKRQLPPHGGKVSARGARRPFPPPWPSLARGFGSGALRSRTPHPSFREAKRHLPHKGGRLSRQAFFGDPLSWHCS
jgi:hypothetical protein